jgi:hypothetical protein
MRARRAVACEGWVIRGQQIFLARWQGLFKLGGIWNRGQGKSFSPGVFLSPFSDLQS